MKRHTRLKRVYPEIVGREFFDGGEDGFGFFKILKAWKCQECYPDDASPDGWRWFDKSVLLIESETGLIYKIPFCPWRKVVDVETGVLWSEFYDRNPW